MIPRKLEPEVMDTEEDAREYDAMDHTEVNRAFVSDFLETVDSSKTSRILDVGTGSAQIPIEFCRQSPAGTITAIDLAEEMLKLAKTNIQTAGLDSRITLELCDSKSLPFGDNSFSAVISNSIIHHIPEPLLCFQEMIRVLIPGGVLFVRDLLRPETQDDVERLVQLHAGGETEYSQQLFRQSLEAALTVEEAAKILEQIGVPGSAVFPSSDRHWTVSAEKP